MLKSLRSVRRKSSVPAQDTSTPRSDDHAARDTASKANRKADIIVVLDNSYSMRLRLPAAKALLRYLALTTSRLGCRPQRARPAPHTLFFSFARPLLAHSACVVVLAGTVAKYSEANPRKPVRPHNKHCARARARVRVCR